MKTLHQIQKIKKRYFIRFYKFSEAAEWQELGVNEYSDEYPITINYEDGTSETTSIFDGVHILEQLKGDMLFIKTFENVINDNEIKSITFFDMEIPIE